MLGRSERRGHLHVPEGVTFDPAKAGVCINGLNGVSVWVGDVHLGCQHHLHTGCHAQQRLRPERHGHVLRRGLRELRHRRLGLARCGFEIGSPTNCTLRNIRAGSSGVDGSNANNPFVFFAYDNVPNANHLGEDLTFHAYPLLGTDGARSTPSSAEARGSHRPYFTGSRLGGVLWRGASSSPTRTRSSTSTALKLCMAATASSRRACPHTTGRPTTTGRRRRFLFRRFEPVPTETSDSNGVSSHRKFGAAQRVPLDGRAGHVDAVLHARGRPG